MCMNKKQKFNPKNGGLNAGYLAETRKQNNGSTNKWR